MTDEQLLFVPADESLLVANPGDQSLEYVVLYAPHGPEIDLRQRFVR